MSTTITPLVSLTPTATAACKLEDPLIKRVTDCLKKFGFDGHLETKRVPLNNMAYIQLTGSFHPDMMDNFRSAIKELADQGINVNAPYLAREETVTVGSQQF